MASVLLVAFPQTFPSSSNPSRDASAGGTQGLCGGVRHQFEEWHKAFLLCFCFVTGKDNLMCFFMHTELSKIAPGLAVSGQLMAGSVNNLVCEFGASSLPPLSIT